MKIKMLLLLVVFVVCLLPPHVFAECIEGNCTDGKGTMTYAGKKGKYVGEFKNDKRDGKGIRIFSDEKNASGQKQYEGQWKEDMPSGQGTLTFYDGRKFVGKWKYETTITKATMPIDGKEMPATYRRVVVSAEGTMYYPDGRKEIGVFINDQFHKK